MHCRSVSAPSSGRCKPDCCANMSSLLALVPTGSPFSATHPAIADRAGLQPQAAHSMPALHAVHLRLKASPSADVDCAHGLIPFPDGHLTGSMNGINGKAGDAGSMVPLGGPHIACAHVGIPCRHRHASRLRHDAAKPCCAADSCCKAANFPCTCEASPADSGKLRQASANAFRTPASCSKAAYGLCTCKHALHPQASRQAHVQAGLSDVPMLHGVSCRYKQAGRLRVAHSQQAPRCQGDTAV